MEKYYAREELLFDDVLTDFEISSDIENVRFENITFHNVTFRDVELVHVTFSRCLIDTCTFSNVTSRRTYFIDSLIRNTSLTSTDFSASRFVRTRLSGNSSLPVTSARCSVDFEFAFSQRAVFFETFVSQLFVIPSSIANAFLMHRYGRVITLG